MNKNSNAYIIIYSTIMVVVVALILAFAASSLRDRQNANEENEMMGAILNSIGEGMDIANAPDKATYYKTEYAAHIKESYGVDLQGNIVEGADAFELLKELKAEYDKPADERVLPVFVSRTADGSPRYILPVRGAGLWGPVWGYIALESDLDTIYGVVFDHQGETPGLGAEIATPAFQNQFRGKSIFRDGELVAVAVLKGTGSSAGNPNAVDAISGGTITSKAVETMLVRCLNDYKAFIEKERAGNTADDQAEPEIDGIENLDINDLNTQENEQ